ncbi:MAG TPA: hypothetical protein PLH97_04935 [Verrucomicrobiota bacterium]|nr:hypothetical protein [Verrucomicrobiota bacterium]
MNDLLTGLTGSPLASRVGWVLTHFLWQGAAIAVLFEIVRLSLWRHSAAARYGAGCCAMVLLPVVPIITLLVQDHAIGSIPAAGEVATFHAPVDLHYHASSGIFVFLGQDGAFLSLLAPWLAVAWAVGVALFSLRLLRSWWWAGRIRTRDCERVEPVLVRTLNALRARLE